MKRVKIETNKTHSFQKRNTISLISNLMSVFAKMTYFNVSFTDLESDVRFVKIVYFNFPSLISNMISVCGKMSYCNVCFTDLELLFMMS